MFSYSVIPSWKNIFSTLTEKNNKNLDLLIKKINNNNYFRLTSSSTWSILIICLLRIKIYNKKNINLFIPEYFCFNALRLLKKNNINIIYYSLDNNLNINIDWKNYKAKYDELTPDIILYVNYFGKKNNPITKNKSLAESWIIEDCTHCIETNKHIGINGDFILMSLYKNFALPNGALLNLNKKTNIKFKEEIIKYFNEEEKWINFIRNIQYSNKINFILYFISDYIWIIKKILQKIIKPNKIKNYEEYLKIQQHNYGFNSPYFSNLAKKALIYQLNRLNLIKIKKNIINKIYFLYIQSLKYSFAEYINFNFNEFKFNDTEYNYRHHLNQKKVKSVYQNLKNLNFPIYLWPDLPPIIHKQKNSLSYKLLTQVIHIANHQSINIKTFINFFKFTNFKIKNNISTKTIDQNEYFETLNDIQIINLTQSFNYGNAIQSNSKNKWITKRIVFFNENNKIAYCQLLIRKFFFIKIYRINKGPVFFKNINDELKQDVLSYLSKLGNLKKLSILFFLPNLPYNVENILLFKKKSFYFNTDPNFSTIFIDLQNNLNDIKSDFKYFWKYSLNKSLKNKLEIKYVEDFANFHSFCLRYVKNSTEKKYKGLDINLLKEVFKNNNNHERLFIIQAYSSKELIGEVCIYIHLNTATYLIGNFNEKGRKKEANNLLLWETINYLKCKKIQYLDLGGLNLKNDTGINFFKRGMGGDEKIFMPESIFI